MARAEVQEAVPDEAMPLRQRETAEPPQRQPTNWEMLTSLLPGAIPEYFLSQILNRALLGEVVPFQTSPIQMNHVQTAPRSMADACSERTRTGLKLR